MRATAPLARLRTVGDSDLRSHRYNGINRRRGVVISLVEPGNQRSLCG